MDATSAQLLSAKLIQFLESGEAPDGLFTTNVFCDISMPAWRLQACGSHETVQLRRNSHPLPGTVPRHRLDPTPTGFVLEVEEQWHDGSQDWYCRELLRADVSAGRIADLSVYCTGDWDKAQQRRHQHEVTLLRP